MPPATTVMSDLRSGRSGEEKIGSQPSAHSAKLRVTKALQGLAGGVQSRGSEAIEQAAFGLRRTTHEEGPKIRHRKAEFSAWPESPVTVKDRTSGWP